MNNFDERVITVPTDPNTKEFTDDIRSEGIEKTGEGNMELSALKQQIFKALEDKRYKWRTPKGIAAQTGIPESEVLSVIANNPDTIVQPSVPSIDGSPLFTTRRHFQETSSLYEKIIGALKGRLR